MAGLGGKGEGGVCHLTHCIRCRRISKKTVLKRFDQELAHRLGHRGLLARAVRQASPHVAFKATMAKTTRADRGIVIEIAETRGQIEIHEMKAASMPNSLRNTM